MFENKFRDQVHGTSGWSRFGFALFQNLLASFESNSTLYQRHRENILVIESF